jgi:hypothetical protein
MPDIIEERAELRGGDSPQNHKMTKNAEEGYPFVSFVFCDFCGEFPSDSRTIFKN